MANTNINIRMDQNLKAQFEEFCDDVGMSMTTAFTIFAKKVVRDYRIPFDVGTENPNEETILAIKEAQALKKDSNRKTYNSFDEILAELENEDEI